MILSCSNIVFYNYFEDLTSNEGEKEENNKEENNKEEKSKENEENSLLLSPQIGNLSFI